MSSRSRTPQASACSSKTGSFTDSAFPESVASMLIMGVVAVLLPAALASYAAIAGIVAVAFAYFIYQWTWIHGGKMDRRLTVYIDEVELLRNTAAFEYEYAALDECSTPISGPEIKRPRPASIFEALFDDRAMKMKEFYKSLYGNEYEHAMRVDADVRAKNAAEGVPRHESSPVVPSMPTTSATTIDGRSPM